MFHIEYTADKFTHANTAWEPWGERGGYRSRRDAAADIIDQDPRPVGVFRIVDDEVA